MTKSNYNALIMSDEDNVATAVKDLSVGDLAKIHYKNIDQVIKVKDNIQFGHKLALCNVEKNREIKKYGEPIGIAITNIRKGEHVHIHNIDSIRGKGELTDNEI
ncbi:UxaA family hydrolase [Gracilibacillus sp. D59]|uniref:UxaA family hydrolase n=1 Tax=Gracilibacillus sp. D59 TaxID=3457434 RepID=UPI003FCD2D70